MRCLSLKSFQDDNEYDGIESANYTFFARLHQKCLELLEQIDYDLNSLDSASHFHFSAQSQRMNEIDEDPHGGFRNIHAAYVYRWDLRDEF